MDTSNQSLTLVAQLLVLSAVAAAAAWPLVCRLARNRWDRILGLTLTVVLTTAIALAHRDDPPARPMLESARLDDGTQATTRKVFKDHLLPTSHADNEYVTSQTCRSCHPGQFATWHRTYHRTMTQVAGPDSVIPDHFGQFDGQVLQARGRTYELSKRGEEYWTRMVDPDWDRDRRAKGLDVDIPNPPIVDRRLVMTTGSHHQQTYWVASRWGYELLQFPWEFHIGEKLWFPTEDAELREESPERYSGHWNSSCIHCHSVAPNPGYLEAGSARPASVPRIPGFDMSGTGRNRQRLLRSDTAALYSQVAELGISCEACHGPAAAHVAHHRNPAKRLLGRLSDKPDPTIVNPRRLDHVRSSEICGRCHALKMPHEKDKLLRERDPYRPGQDLASHYRVVRFDDPVHQEMSRQGSHLYWDDGSCRLGGREFLGQIASRCYTHGKMSCLSCHAMHDSDPNDQLIPGMRKNRACVQCHDDYTGERLVRHTHHAAGSTGSLCVNCHMPHTSYALFTAIRIHRIKSPEVLPVQHAAQPNACNLCHLDKTLDWTSRHMNSWYGTPRTELPDEERQLAAGILWMLRGDAAQRAIAAWHTNWKPAMEASASDTWAAPLLAHLLEDSYSANRFIAWQRLKALPRLKSLDYNFVGPVTVRGPARQWVLERWATAKTNSPDPLPVDSQGRLDLKRLADLWTRRDQRSVEIPE